MTIHSLCWHKETMLWIVMTLRISELTAVVIGSGPMFGITVCSDISLFSVVTWFLCFFMFLLFPLIHFNLSANHKSVVRHSSDRICRCFWIIRTMECFCNKDWIIGSDSLKIRRRIFDGVLYQGNVLGPSDVVLFGGKLVSIICQFEKINYFLMRFQWNKMEINKLESMRSR